MPREKLTWSASPRARHARRRGSMMVYCIYIVLVSTAMISVAVDYGRMQMIKTQMQRCADATARGTLATCLHYAQIYGSYGYTPTTLANTYAATIAASMEANNPIDAKSNIAATYQVHVGSWYQDSSAPAPTFHWDAGAHSPLAVQVLISRTVATGNPVPLIFPLPNGKTFVSRTCDIWAVATAVLPNTTPIGETIQATQDPWLAGMPVGSTASDYDSVSTNSVTAGNNPSNGYDANSTVAVTPGAIITWQVMNAHMSHLQPPVYYSADGMTSNPYWHLKDGPVTEPEGSGGQNGIGDIYTPIDSVIGVFLDNAPPTDPSNTAYANYANANMRNYTNDLNEITEGDIHIQQPFYIGDGTNMAGTQRSFVVPSNATRMFLGMMDGYQWSNNSGSFTVQGTQQPPIQMVQ
jgi:Flp pilus assembly protein TadG